MSNSEPIEVNIGPGSRMNPPRFTQYAGRGKHKHLHTEVMLDAFRGQDASFVTKNTVYDPGV